MSHFGKDLLTFFESLLQLLDDNFSFLFSLLAVSNIIANTKNPLDVPVLT